MDGPAGADDHGRMRADVGIVVIGRNEGERLSRCLASFADSGCGSVYVDSGSADDSVARAARAGVDVLRLDPARPFTAARARNEGFARLVATHPGLRFVQFLDGDTEVEPGWLLAAWRLLDATPACAACSGRRKERFPEASVFNALCDIEWDTPVGDTRSFGGDVMIRRDAFAAAGGYRVDLIAGEDPDLALRIARAGGGIRRLDAPMTLHDAAMTNWRQWFRRSMRAGYAFAEGAWEHRAAPGGHFVRETVRSVAWGLLFAALAGAVLAGAWSPAAVLAALTLAQFVRVGARSRGRLDRPWLYAAFMLQQRIPEFLGVVKYALTALSGRRGRLIEYK